MEIPHSKFKFQLATLLKDEGYVSDVKVEGDGTKKVINIELKYSDEGASVISGMNRLSKPGNRVYSSFDNLLVFQDPYKFFYSTESPNFRKRHLETPFRRSFGDGWWDKNFWSSSLILGLAGGLSQMSEYTQPISFRRDIGGPMPPTLHTKQPSSWRFEKIFPVPLP